MEEEQPGYNSAFQAYLREHRLSSWEVAQKAGVRYTTMWSILRNKPVTREHAAQVRACLHQMTGIPYVGPIATLSS